jgi:tetratricopeptide (TPR) repeat protein
MTQHKTPSTAIQEIKSLIKNRFYEDALAQCNDLLKRGREDRADILRQRAHVYGLLDQYENAVNDRRTIIDEGQATGAPENESWRRTLADHFLAAGDALSAKQFSQAAEWFKEVIRLGELHKEQYFAGATYFHLSHIHMELGQFQEAITSLDQAVAISPDIRMPFTPDCRLRSHTELREEITRRSKR